jgi:hypothetical protein
MPDSKFNSSWNLIMTVLLLYTASYMPFRISFIDSSTLSNIIFDTFIDFLFIMDIFINFFSAYEDPKVGLEVRIKRIAANYVFTWFVFDIFSCIPLQLLEIEDISSDDSGDGKDV